MHLRALRFLVTVALFSGWMVTAPSRSQVPASANPPAQAATTWPIFDGTVTLPNFRFGSGETLSELRLHYITL